MENRPVFFDPAGRRRTVYPRVLAFLILVAAVVGLAFYITLMAVPTVRSFDPERHRSGFIPRSNGRPKINTAILSRDRQALFADIEKSRPPLRTVSNPQSPVVAAFFDPSIETGVSSLRAFGGHLTHVIPAWLHLTTDGGDLDLGDFDFDANPHNLEVVSEARKAGVRIMPLLSNASGSQFDPGRVHRLLTSPPMQDALVTKLRDWIVHQGFQGLNIDFEDLPDPDERVLPKFLQRLKTALNAADLEISLDVESSNTTDPDLLRAFAASCDWMVLMAYDEHWETSPPGPIASLKWADSLLDQALSAVPANKLVLGIGNYSYDWQEGAKTAEPLTYQEALTTASDFRDGEKASDVIDFDETALNSTFEYDDTDNAGKTIPHTVWMLDAASAYNQWLGASNRGLRGSGVWALGEEDPGIWTFLTRAGGTFATHPMEAIQFPYGVDQMGKGEVLKVVRRPSPGQRSFEVDPKRGFITDMTYQSYPFPFVIEHIGYIPKALAITFDDGPDSRYTPQVLDELKRLGISATFFDVGRNVESNPGLVRRAYDQGCEIGNHTFTHPDLSTVSPRRAQLEMNATQRAIQSVTGHSTIMFRPPFNADSEPSTPSEVEPVDMADKIGYTTIGEKIDPQDWNPQVVAADGTTRTKSAQDIADSIVSGVHEFENRKEEGNIILLHDAGGPRDSTIASLRLFVPKLQSEGYRFVTVSQLLNRTRDSVMPPITPQDRLSIWFDGLVFSGVFSGEAFLAFSFLTAIGLGIARVLFVAPLAIFERRTAKLAVYDPAFTVEVTALIAAYNEETVICRTIESVLASEYPLREVLVIDDGSKDRTYDVVMKTFGNDGRVRVVRQENGGKASALNHGFGLCQSEFAFCIDADTQLDPNAIGKLIRHFQDPKVAAVAGNVKVGNAINVLTKWQALEYTTSQNLDRRAYAYLNSITVVPGAIGAWRKSAVLEVGGYQTDTLAEDMDLTWRLRRQGYRLDNESEAYAYTEAPDTFKGFFKQRFRWAYGTLQCLAKHRGAVGRYEWFGRLALPTMWIFQIVFQALAPLVDLQVLYSLTGWVSALRMVNAASESGLSTESSQMLLAGASTSLIQVLILYVVFFAIELAAGFLSYWLEGDPPKPLVWLFLQRFAYRQIMYGVIYKSIGRALAGGREGWGVLERKGTVKAR